VAESQFGPAFIAGDISQSDASLIASAPDLLDALGWSLSYIKVRLASEPDPDHQAAFDAALSTLRKAKGE
jgi:hypothetical protein